LEPGLEPGPDSRNKQNPLPTKPAVLHPGCSLDSFGKVVKKKPTNPWNPLSQPVKSEFLGVEFSFPNYPM